MIDIYPAIDLKDGKAVRLYKGEMSSAKIYGEALDFAKKFEDMGASWIHIVDLNGAFKGSPQNINQIEQILAKTKLSIQLGGGIRDEECIKLYQSLGIKRLILGSIALNNPQFVLDMAKKYCIAVGIDAKNGKVATQGWANSSDEDAFNFAAKFKSSSVNAIICTDINRDGALSGINIDFTQNIAKNSGIYTIASGGFASESEFEKLCNNELISGVIVGKAFYEGRIDLANMFKKYT